MAMIPMTSGFSICPKGIHVFRIYKVDYDEDFGKLVVHLVNAQGVTHQERFSLMKADGSANEGACNAFSFFAKISLNDFEIQEVDPHMLVDRYIKADVIHTNVQSNKDPNKEITFIKLGDKWSSEGFESTPVPRALSLGKEKPTNSQVTSEPKAPTVIGELDITAMLK